MRPHRKKTLVLPLVLLSCSLLCGESHAQVIRPVNQVTNPKTGQLVTPPEFATMWKLRSVEESNDQGSWANWTLEKVGLVEDRDTFMEAKSFRESVAAGEAKAAPEDQPADNSVQSDDIPF